ncbi:stalk domain-containing protein [Fusobacterium gastrosuis]
MGTIHNSEIGEYTADLLDLDLDKLTKNLYVDAIPTFEKKGAKVEFVEKTPNNFELVITKGIQEIKVPMYKNYAIVNEKKIDLKGLTIFNGEKVYVPKSLIDMIE